MLHNSCSLPGCATAEMDTLYLIDNEGEVLHRMLSRIFVAKIRNDLLKISITKTCNLSHSLTKIEHTSNYN